MAWLELKLKINSETAELVSSILENNNALAVTLQDAGDQPIYEPDINDAPPVWDEVIATGLFDAQTDLKKILALILDQFPNIHYEIKHLAEQQWERTWMQDFAPMEFGERLRIIPSYHSETHGATEVVLDPGLAFGTGKHPTTAMCLRWLDQHIQGDEVVMDYGCGSGILSIAAIKLGAAKVLAVDHDPQAIHATQENAVRNGIDQKQISTYFPQDLTNTQAVDVLIANILANPLIQLANVFATFIKAKGQLVLSGILQEQSQDVIEAYQPWFKMKHLEHQEDWVRIDFEKL